MADICVLYGAGDDEPVRQLVSLLRRDWDVWWGDDIPHGDWEAAAREQISIANIVLPVFSPRTNEKRNFRGEVEFACELNKPLFPFVIGKAEIPLGIRHLSRTDAAGWDGTAGHAGFKQLRKKLLKVLPEGKRNGQPHRLREISVRHKQLRLPAFVFSLSSHETQVSPSEGATLLRLLEPRAALISAYDVWACGKTRSGTELRKGIREFRESDAVLFLDSGNYEAYRKGDGRSKQRPDGWQNEYFLSVAEKNPPDLAFAFDAIDPVGSPDQVAAKAIKNFRRDDKALSQRDFCLCPIVHVPKDIRGPIADCVAKIVAAVASALDPIMVAIPERELGDGLRERAKTVRKIRQALDALGKYYPLHLLGTGNPLSMIALAAAGADSFDGLEWCRTVAEYQHGHLFHFQHFDCFEQSCSHQIQDQGIRHIVSNPKASYAVKALAYNVDFFKDWTRTMQEMIHAGQVETLLKMIPNIGPIIFRDISE